MVAIDILEAINVLLLGHVNHMGLYSPEIWSLFQVLHSLTFRCGINFSIFLSSDLFMCKKKLIMITTI
jgi:hypothetical protein